MLFNFYKRLFTQFILSIGGSGGSSKSKGQSTSESFQGIKVPFTLDAIRSIIGLQGLTPELREQRSDRKAVADKAGAAADSFSFDSIKEFSGDAINQFIRQQNEKNKPVISKAVEGAGVSGDALAGLLTNDLNVRTSQAAATLLTNILKDTGSVQAENLRTQAGLSTIDSTGINALLAAIDATKVGEANQQSTNKSSSFNASFNIL